MNPRNVMLIAWSGLVEARRRKELLVLLMFMIVYFVGAVIVNITGIENAATGTFLLNLGMTMAYYFALALAILTAARQVPGDFEQRTLYPLLGKPVDRAEYVLGRWLSATIVGWVFFVVLMALAWIPAPRMEYYSFPMLLQTLVLLPLAIAMMAAITLSLALRFPAPVTIVLIALLLVAGQPFAGLLSQRFAASPLSSAVNWLTAYIPEPGRLNTITRYTDGVAPIPPVPFALAIAYPMVMAAGFLAIAVLRRRLRVR